MKTFKELLISEKVTWNQAEVATQDAYNTLKQLGTNLKRTSKNGFKIIHDNGCVGNVVFDPSLTESVLDESKTISGVFVVDGDSKEQPAKVTLEFSTLNSQKNGMLKITAGGKTYELHVDGDLTKLL